MGTDLGARQRSLLVVAGLVAGLVAVAPGVPASAQVPGPSFAKAFAPATIGPGSTTTLTLTIDNAGGAAATDLAFTDTLPAGMTVAAAPAAVNGCGGTLTAPAGGGQIALDGGAVAAGASCTVSVDVTASTPGTLTNESGPLSSSAGVGPAAVAELNVTTALPGFSKTFTPASVWLGSRATLTFTVDNTLNTAGVSAFSFTDRLPAGMVIAEPNGASTDCGPAALPSAFSPVTAVPGSDRVDFAGFGSSPSNEVVAAGASCTIVVDVVAGAVGVAANRTDPASVAISNGPLGAGGRANARLEVEGSRLGVVKEFVDDPILPGGQGTLRFSVTNYDRDADATGISFVDDLDAALAGLVAAAPLPVEPCGAGSTLAGSDELLLAGGSLPAGGSCTFDVTIEVPADAPPTQADNVTGDVVGLVDGVEVVGGRAADTLFVVLTPVVTKEFVDDPQGAGGTVTLEFSVRNPDPDEPMTDVAFDDVLDPVLPSAVSVAGTPAPPPPAEVSVNNVCGAGSELRYTPLNPTVANAPATLRLTGGSLAAGDACTFSAVLRVATAAPTGAYPNATSAVTAEFLGSTVVGAPATDDLVIVGAPPIRKRFVDDPIAPGDAVTLEFRVVNGGDDEPDFDSVGPVEGISFSDDLGSLAGATVLGPLPIEPCGPGSVVSTSAGGTVLTLTGGNLPQDTSCTFAVVVQTTPATPQGLFTNTTGNVTATASGVSVVGPGASDDLLVTDVIVDKEFVDDPVLAGGTVDLRFTIDNRGPLPASGITFSDDLSVVLPGLVLDQVTGNDCGGTVGGTTVIAVTDALVGGGAACTITAELTVPAGAEPGLYANATSAVALTVDGVAVTLPPATDELEIADPPAIGLTKEFTDDPSQPGAPVNLRFTVSNPSAVAVGGIGFTDDLASTLTGLVATSVPPTPCGGSLTASAGGTLLTFAGGSVAPGQHCVFDVGLTVPVDAAPGSYPNVTSAVTADLGVLGAAAGDVLVVEPIDPDRARADLSITKVDDVDPVFAGQPVTYTIEVFNAGPNAAPGVVVVDTLPAGVILLSTSGCLNDPFTLTCDLGDLPAGTGASFALTVLVDGGTTGELVNTATVASGIPDTQLADNTAVETTEVIAAADLSISKVDDPDPVVAGTELTYTVEVVNAGPATAIGVVVTDTLPAGLSGATTVGCAEDPAGVGGCSLGDIAPGAVASFSVTADVDPSALGELTNTATVDAENADPDPSDNTVTETTTVVASADLSISKVDDADPVVAGTELTYTVEVANAGPSDATNVVVADTLPAGVSNAATTGCAEDPDGVPSCALGTIAAGSSATFTVTVTVDASTAGTITNVASVTSDASDPDAANDVAREDTFVRNGADLAIEKVDDVDPIEAHSDERLTYTITVTNLGPFTAEDVVVTDTLPFGVQFKETVGCAEDKGGIPTCSLGDLAAGASASYTVVVKMKTQSPLGTMTNTASVASPTLDQDPSNDVATEDTLVCRKKTSFGDCGQPGAWWPLAVPSAGSVGATRVTPSVPPALVATPAGGVAGPPPGVTTNPVTTPRSNGGFVASLLPSWPPWPSIPSWSGSTGSGSDPSRDVFAGRSALPTRTAAGSTPATPPAGVAVVPPPPRRVPLVRQGAPNARSDATPTSSMTSTPPSATNPATPSPASGSVSASATLRAPTAWTSLGGAATADVRPGASDPALPAFATPDAGGVGSVPTAALMLLALGLGYAVLGRRRDRPITG